MNNIVTLILHKHTQCLDCLIVTPTFACRVLLSWSVHHTSISYGPEGNVESFHLEQSQKLHYEDKQCSLSPPSWKRSSKGSIYNQIFSWPHMKQLSYNISKSFVPEMEQVLLQMPASLSFVEGETSLVVEPYVFPSHKSSQMPSIWMYSYQTPFL